MSQDDDSSFVSVDLFTRGVYFAVDERGLDLMKRRDNTVGYDTADIVTSRISGCIARNIAIVTRRIFIKKMQNERIVNDTARIFLSVNSRE